MNFLLDRIPNRRGFQNWLEAEEVARFVRIVELDGQNENFAAAVAGGTAKNNLFANLEKTYLHAV